MIVCSKFAQKFRGEPAALPLLLLLTDRTVVVFCLLNSFIDWPTSLRVFPDAAAAPSFGRKENEIKRRLLLLPINKIRHHRVYVC